MAKKKKNRKYLGSCTPPKKYGGGNEHKSIGGRFYPNAKSIAKYYRFLEAATKGGLRLQEGHVVDLTTYKKSGQITITSPLSKEEKEEKEE